MQRSLLGFAILLFLISPFLFLLFSVTGQFQIQTNELFWAIKNSFFQSLLSSFFCLLFGFIAALGLMKTHQHRPAMHAILVVLCLIPQFIPVVVVLISVMNGLQPFPMGLPGIVIVHVMSYFGMTAILIQNQAQEVLSQTSQAAQVMGCSRLMYYRKIGFPMLRKDLILIFTYLTAVFFSSFSVPLIVGGGRGTTLEVLIFEKMRLSTDWSPAVLLSLVQTAILFVLSFLALKGRAQFTKKEVSLKWLGSYSGVFLILIITAAFFASFANAIIDGLSQIGNLSVYGQDLFEAFLASLFLAFLSYASVMSFLYAFCGLGRVPHYLDTFLNGYIAPSTALTCFGLLVYFPAEFYWSYIKIPLAFLLLSLPSVYRLGWGEKLKSLDPQIQIAKSLGAGQFQILSQVTWPQMKSHSRFMSGLVATWVCGDFAVSRILSTRDFTLGLIVESLMTSYRLGLASLLSLLLILACGLCFFIVLGLDYVDNRKFKN